jgi:DHA2 family multidrug resistance protein
MRVDTIGLALLILWIGALQIILDIGREHDWFGDSRIVVLAIIALVGFAIFLAWELTEAQPIVNLRVFRHRGFSAAVLSLALAFGTMFSAVVLIPQWLQTDLGYTATDAGYVTAFMGVAAVIMSPIVGKLSDKVDPRILVTFGILWLGLTSILRARWTTGADFWTLAFPQMMQGIGMPFFFIPLTSIALSAVDPEETASAAGVMSFLRTMAGAIGTSVATTLWANNAVVARNEIVDTMNSEATREALQGAGFSLDQVRGIVEQTVQQESLTVAINHMFLLSAAAFVFAAAVVWLAPRPRRVIEAGAAH